MGKKVKALHMKFHFCPSERAEKQKLHMVQSKFMVNSKKEICIELCDFWLRIPKEDDI